jgi:hypothetical protein
MASLVALLELRIIYRQLVMYRIRRLRLVLFKQWELVLARLDFISMRILGMGLLVAVGVVLLFTVC